MPRTPAQKQATDRYRAIYQNQLSRDPLARLTHSGKAGRDRRAGINESIMTRAVFNRLLIVEIE